MGRVTVETGQQIRLEQYRAVVQRIVNRWDWYAELNIRTEVLSHETLKLVVEMEAKLLAGVLDETERVILNDRPASWFDAWKIEWLDTVMPTFRPFCRQLHDRIEWPWLRRILLHLGWVEWEIETVTIAARELLIVPRPEFRRSIAEIERISRAIQRQFVEYGPRPNGTALAIMNGYEVQTTRDRKE